MLIIYTLANNVKLWFKSNLWKVNRITVKCLQSVVLRPHTATANCSNLFAEHSHKNLARSLAILMSSTESTSAWWTDEWCSHLAKNAYSVHLHEVHASSSSSTSHHCGRRVVVLANSNQYFQSLYIRPIVCVRCARTCGYLRAYCVHASTCVYVVYWLCWGRACSGCLYWLVYGISCGAAVNQSFI